MAAAPPSCPPPSCLVSPPLAHANAGIANAPDSPLARAAPGFVPHDTKAPVILISKGVPLAPSSGIWLAGVEAKDERQYKGVPLLLDGGVGHCLYAPSLVSIVQFAMRSLAMSTYLSVISIPMHVRPVMLAASSDVPVPANGSSTVSPGRDPRWNK